MSSSAPPALPSPFPTRLACGMDPRSQDPCSLVSCRSPIPRPPSSPSFLTLTLLPQADILAAEMGAQVVGLYWSPSDLGPATPSAPLLALAQTVEAGTGRVPVLICVSPHLFAQPGQVGLLARVRRGGLWAEVGVELQDEAATLSSTSSRLEALREAEGVDWALHLDHPELDWLQAGSTALGR